MLSARQQKCVRLMASGEMTQRQIAEELKVSEQTICTWKKNPEFIKEYTQTIKRDINTLPGRALRVIENVMLFADKPADRLRAARDILDRAGFAPVEYSREERPDSMKDNEEQGVVVYLPEKEIDEDTMIKGPEPLLRSTVKRMSDRRKKELLQILNEED